MLNHPSRHQRFFAELKRRKVFRVIAVYGAVAFGIIQVADPVGDALRVPEWFLPTIIAFLLIGFPVAVVLAWAFEVTPDGVRRAERADLGEIEAIVGQPASKRWTPGVLALCGMAVLVAGAWFAGRESAPVERVVEAEMKAPAGAESGPGVVSIAVLPFTNMSSDPDQEYFSEGISEELLNLLARIPELRVAARTSSFSFKGQNLEITDIARRLDVGHVLEGSVRKSGEQIRVTAQLIRAEDGFHVWSNTWDRTLEDIFAIQDEIAADVVDQLRVTLLAEAPTVEETDPEAYGLVLRARHVGARHTPESISRAEELYRQALAIDPEYAAAWSGLAQNHLQRSFFGAPWDSVAALGREAAERALSVDPEYAPAHSILGRIAKSDGELDAAARHYRHALALEPGDARIVGSAATVMSALGRIEESTRLHQYSVARDPVRPGGHLNLGLAYMGAHRPADAVESIRTALELNPSMSGVRSLLGQALLFQGRPEEALEQMRADPDEFWRLVGLVQAHHALGESERSDAALAELIEKHERDGAFNIAYALAFRGEVDRAFEWLDRAERYGDPGLSEIFFYPQFDILHDDPRWTEFLDRIGKSPEELAAIDFEVELPQ